ncbi:LAZY 1-like protein [Drosera capensis]
MKFLTWMHRKLRQSNGEALKEHPLGRPSLDNQKVFQKCNSSGTLRQPPRVSYSRISFSGIEVARLDDLEEEASTELSDLFHGFLAIGTLGIDTVITEPETPKFVLDDLKQINDELAKVLGDEAKYECWTESSRRNSLVSNGRSSHASSITLSNGRSSHASTITLSGKSMEDTYSNVVGTIVCPLQGYLLGSGVELPEKTSNTRQEEHRTSLQELFQRQKAEEKSRTKGERAERHIHKEGEKTALNILKRILKRKDPKASSKSSSANNPVSHEDVAPDTKLQKIIQKFHQKVHPERPVPEKKLDRPHKTKIKTIISNHLGYNNGGQTAPDKDTAMLTEHLIHMSKIQRSKSNPPPSQSMVPVRCSNETRECWVKTDADSK